MKITVEIITINNMLHSRMAAVNMLLDVSCRADMGERKGTIRYPDGVVGEFVVTPEVAAQ